VRLVVFGASGTCGSHFVRLATMHGHAVTAIVRATSRFVSREGVTVVRGDVLDTAFTAAVIPGHDAVMSGLGMRYKHPWSRRESPDDFTYRATLNIVTGMKPSDVRKISVISAAGVGDSRAALNWPMRFLLATSNVGTAYAALERAEHVLRESGLDWQAVRPTTLTRGAATGRVRITDRYPATAGIPREDVAAFMLRELESPQFTERTPMITAA
jgi:biliverdin reductase / flavin reductase